MFISEQEGPRQGAFVYSCRMHDESAVFRVGGGSIELRRGDRVFATLPVSFSEVRPFLKWTGGKQWLAPIATEIVPPEFCGTYHEVFLGGGALFFALRPSFARLSDTNEELIATYAAVRDQCDEVIETLSRYPHDADFYDRLRKRKPRKPWTTAARFIYLNKTAFNGIYRVNRQGKFNVPFGRYQNPTICQEDRLRIASNALGTASVEVADFEAAMENVVPGDFVYLDPPYITGHRNNGFVKYNSRLFSWSDQERLAVAAKRLSQRGAWVLVSNADHPNVWGLYEGFNRYTVTRASLVGGPLSSRGETQEVLLANYPIAGVPTLKVV